MSLLLFLLTVAIRLTLFAVLDRWEIIMRSEIEQVAISLMKTGDFADPYHIPTGRTAHVAPVYPFFLSLIYRVFGTGLAGEWADQAFSVLITASLFALLPLVSSQLFGEKLPGIFAGLAGALSPAALLVETQGKEAPLAAFLFLLVVATSAWLLRKRAFAPQHAVLYGLVWALTLLVYPGYLLVLLGMLVLAGVYLHRTGRRAQWQFPILTLAACAVFLSPWVLRNYMVFGRIFYLRDNFGLELALSNHDAAKVTMDENAAAGAFQRHPWRSKEEAYRVKELGEYEYHQTRMREAMAWIFSHPAAFAKFTAHRIIHFWFPYREKWYRAMIFSSVNLTALFGLAILYARNRFLALAIAFVWVLYSVPYWFIQGDARYYYPIGWTMLLIAGLAVVTALRRIKFLPQLTF